MLSTRFCLHIVALSILPKHIVSQSDQAAAAAQCNSKPSGHLPVAPGVTLYKKKPAAHILLTVQDQRILLPELQLLAAAANLSVFGIQDLSLELQQWVGFSLHCLRISKAAVSPILKNSCFDLQKIELKVPLCCVKEIMFDTSTQKVVVIGHLDVQLEPSMVLNAVKKVKNRAELWKPSKNS
ncbi:hypothetical protein AXG93_1736s1060 [Marchantia polymorpha subsp. ruderalis]|uniref:Uncharacterized protein n=1 Tax=Marchantia polymorpha subsp. ruderalis TaxID=1480154 RepID=A0A176W5Z9_MARPO|nr:hypothetical protein AXG93_1736s1060 [Marchantia polymorpha subsp. ruderalis]